MAFISIARIYFCPTNILMNQSDTEKEKFVRFLLVMRAHRREKHSSNTKFQLGEADHKFLPDEVETFQIF